MNALTHAKWTMELLQEAHADIDIDQAMLGSILPDLSEAHVFPVHHAHVPGMDFITYTNKKLPSLTAYAVGFTLHGENPEQGLDYYTHKTGGFLDKTRERVRTIVRKYRLRFSGYTEEEVIHTLTEVSCDTLVEKPVAERLNHAFKKANIKQIALHTTTFFKGDNKKALRVLRFIKRIDYTQLHRPEYVTNIFQKLMLLRDKNKSKLHTFKSILGNLNPFQKRRITHAIRETSATLHDDYTLFIARTREAARKQFIKNMRASVMHHA